MTAMSASYDKRTGRPLHPPRYAEPEYDPRDDAVTGPVTASSDGWPAPNDYPVTQTTETSGAYGPYGDANTARLEPDASEILAPARSHRKGRTQLNAPIVPAGSVTGRSLTLVIAIMCFLACLTAGAVYMINQSADAWLKDIASEVTVQIEPKEGAETDKTVAEVAKLLQEQTGIRSVKVMTLEDSSKLLEPWLGSTDALKALPVPRLVALEVDRSSPPDLDAVRKMLTEKFKGVTLDDHRHWQNQIRTVTRSFALGGLAILLLVGAATTAIIVSATKSSMASNREIVEVLHFIGATDRFIAREFEKHFLRLGIRAGFVGATFAMLVFFLMPTAMDMLGGGTVTTTELNRLIGSGALDLAGYVLLCIVVVVIAGLCMVTSRLGVYSILNMKR